MTGAGTGRPVVVTHPVHQHAYRTALAAQRSGMLEAFWTGFYRTGRGLTSERALNALPRRPGAAVRRELSRRWEPELDPARVRTLVRYDAASVAWRRLLRAPGQLWDPVPWVLRGFDAAVAKRLDSQPPRLVHAFEGAALSSFTVARRRGVLTILDCPSAHERFVAVQRASGRAPRDPGTDRIRRERELADRILAPSAQVVECLTAHGVPPAKIALVPYGADPLRFSPPAGLPGSGGSQPGRPLRFLFVGTIEPRKGIGELLAAWRLAALPRAELVLLGPVGTGARGLLEQLPAGVTWPGGVPPGEVPRWFAASDVFAFPSRAEGSALVTYEAMAAGLPSIVTAEAGSVVRDGEEGFIVPAADPAAIAARLCQLYDQPLLRSAMGARARAAVEREWTWSHYERRLTDVWMGLL